MLHWVRPTARPAAIVEDSEPPRTGLEIFRRNTHPMTGQAEAVVAGAGPRGRTGVWPWQSSASSAVTEAARQ